MELGGSECDVEDVVWHSVLWCDGAWYGVKKWDIMW